MDSFSQETPKPFVNALVVRLASGDNSIDTETNNLKEIILTRPLTTKELLFAGFKIYLAFHFSFFIIGFMFWKLGDFQDDTHNARNVFFAIFMVFFIQVFGSIYILSTEHAGSLKEDLEYLIGEKSLLETLAFLNPIKGIINLFRNLSIFIDPIATLVETIYN